MLVKSMKSNNLSGEIVAPPDKSISHRAVILSSLTSGISSIENLLFSEDINVTLNWAKSIGIIFKKNINVLEVISHIDINARKNCNSFHKFYLGNSGTSARLLMGVMSGLGGISLFYGDNSLSNRPMLRVIKPLVFMNTEIWARENNDNKDLNNLFNFLSTSKDINLLNNSDLISDLKLVNEANMKNVYLPVLVKGKGIKGITYTLNIASAQVKSAILLAGLFTEEETAIVELNPSRDHTENMLRASGVNLKIENYDKGKVITLPKGRKHLKPNNWKIPGDFSSAAFFIIASLIVPRSHVVIKDVNLNPLRTGLLRVLIEMGANINIIEKRELCGEKFGNLEVRYTKHLKPVVVDKELVPLMIDEFPVLFCLVSLVEGKSKFYGIEELRYKECDRISVMETNLNNLGIRTISVKDSLTIFGNPNIVKHPKIKVNPELDHRIAMSFLVLGLTMINGIEIEDIEIINTSFPQFINIMKSLGAKII